MVSNCVTRLGHTGGTLSVIDIEEVLYLKVMWNDPGNPEWDDSDHLFWSGFEGYPNRFKLPGLELSRGSLDQGLGEAWGLH